MDRNYSNLLEKIALGLLGVLLFLFPLTFTIWTTDAFVLPKQILIGLTTFAALILFGVKSVAAKKVILRKTPFDLPIVLFAAALTLSTFFATAKFDSATALFPIFFLVILFFTIVNFAKDEKSNLFLLTTFVAGAFISAAISALYYFKIYILPFTFTHAPNFNTFGSLLDQAVYLVVAAPVAAALLLPFVFDRKSNESQEKRTKRLVRIGAFGFVTAVILVSLLITIYQLFTTQKPFLLPFGVGFQTALAAISQDSQRILQGLLFGSGFGTFVENFTRYKPAEFNLNQTLWGLTFFRSSSFALELLATTGILGIASYAFLLFKAFKERPIFAPLVLVVLASLLLPFSFTSIALLFIVLALYASIQGLHNDNKFYDIELELLGKKKGLISMEPVDSKTSVYTRNMAYIVLGLIAVIIITLGYFSARFVFANLLFQQSLVAAAQNNGSLTYNRQSEAIKAFPYSDNYHRIYSQTNLALANSLLQSVPQGGSPSADTQRTAYTLIQQSINSARSATNLSNRNAINWQNLSSIYRALIGFGQNADSFALLAAQQAVLLDPNNPQEYINFGGIYFQIRNWDKAQEQFQIAANMKPDFANAYYNLGHTLAQKGDLKGALVQFQTVKNIVANDKPNLDKINAEIAELEKLIGQVPQAQTPSATTGEQPPLNVNTTTPLPSQKPEVKIPGPSETLTPSPTPAN